MPSESALSYLFLCSLCFIDIFCYL